MTPTDKQQAFFNGVVYAIRKMRVVFHWPNTNCFRNSCTWRALSPSREDVVSPCNWESIHVLAMQFFDNAPNVPYGWRRAVESIGFDSDYFHELLIGVFISGERNPMRLDRAEQAYEVGVQFYPEVQDKMP